MTKSLSIQQFAARVTDILPHLFREFARRERNDLTQGYITFPQLVVLESVARMGRVKMSDLAAILSVKSSSATVLVDRLIRRKFLVRERDSGDRRLVWVRMTSGGKAVIAKFRKEKQKSIQEIFAVLNARERSEYLRIFEKVRRAMGQALMVVAIGICVFGHEGAAQETLTLGLEDVSRLGVTEGLGIQILDLDVAIKETDITLKESVYDTRALADGSFEYDESQSNSAFGSAEKESYVINGRMKKLFSFGTEVELSASTRHDKLNNSFVNFDPASETVGSVKLRQNVLKNFFGSGERLDLRQVRLDVRRFRYETLTRIQNKVFEIRQAYWQYREGHSQLMNEKQSLRDAWRLHEITKGKVKLGLLEEPDHFASMSNVKKKEINVLIQENVVEDRNNRLKTLLSIPLETPVIFAGTPESRRRLPDMGELMNAAMVNRYDYKEARLALEKQGVILTMRNHELWPRFDIEASLSTNGLDEVFADSYRKATDGEFPAHGVRFEIEWPIENRDAVSKSRRAKWAQKQALLELEDLEKRIHQEVDEAYREEALSFERLKRLRQITELEKRKLNEELKRYQRGRSSSDLIIDYQDDYRLAKIQEDRAYAGWRIAQDEVLRSVGGLLDPYVSKEGVS